MKIILFALALMSSSLVMANDCTIKRLNLILDQDAQEIVKDKLLSLGYAIDSSAEKGLTVEMGMQIQGEYQTQECTNCGLAYEIEHRTGKFFRSLSNGEKSQFFAIANENGEYLLANSKIISRKSTDLSVAKNLIKNIPACNELKL
jgi:hypothetical protein